MLARTDVVMVGILTIAVLGVVCDALFRRLLEGCLPQKRAPAPADAASDRRAETKATGALPALPLPAVDIKSLRAGYADASGEVRRMPLADVTLRLERGAVTALLGRSGCGKTTLLKVIAGLLPAASGRVRFEYPEGAPADAKPVLGVVFQTPMLLPWKTVRENVELALLPLAPEERRVKAESALALAGLLDRAQDWPQNLSGGQQQRLCIARGIAVQPEVLLLDEPCSALDPISTARSEDLIDELKKDYTVVIVTHSMQQAARISDYTAFMYLGELIEFGPTQKIFLRPEKKATEDYITGRFG